MSGELIKTFQEGVLLIMKNYGLKHIKLRGDSIFGVLPTPKQNGVNNKKIFDCAMDVSGFLKSFWKQAEYKVAISLSKEMMLIIDHENRKEIVFASGSSLKAKKVTELEEQKNCILIDKSFVKNNEKMLYSNNGPEPYVTGKTTKGNFFSNWYFKDWE